MVNLKKENISIVMPEEPNDLKYIETKVNEYCANAIVKQIKDIYPDSIKAQQDALNYFVKYVEMNGFTY